MLPEEVFGVVHLAVGSHGQVVGIEGGNVEHLAGAFCIGGGDERGVEIVKPSVVEIFMDGKCHGMTQTKHAAEVVGAGTQMADLAEELQAVAFLLQRIGLGISGAVHLDLLGLYFYHLSFALRLHQRAGDVQTGTCGDFFHQLLVKTGKVGHNLEIMHDGAVVQCDESYGVVASFRSYPAFYADSAT